MTDQELQGEKIIMEINDVKCVNCGHPITEFCQELLVVTAANFSEHQNEVTFHKEYVHRCPMEEIKETQQ
jgi:hypothetical protein